MHTARYVIRPAASTCGGRAAARCVPNAARGISHWASVPSPYARAAQSDFASLFRLLDDASSRAFDNFFPVLGNGVAARSAQLPLFQPRFDVREVDNTYELRGELPGVKPEDLSVEFTDAQTLVIKGRSTRETTTGTPPTAAEGTQAIAPATDAAALAENASDTASVLSASSYQKPSVEDADVAESSASGAVPTPTSSTAPSVTGEQAPSAPQVSESSQQEPSNGRYWMSERSVGEFQRTFNFPARVDQDAVKASLKDGLLSLTVPKAAAPETRRISLE